MAFNRHLGRIVALQTLYEFEFREECKDKNLELQDILQRNINRYSETIDDTAFVERLVEGTLSKIGELDAKIQPIAPEWPLSQIARIDRAILRMSVYEMLFANDTPPKVVINEAVELAKSFGGDNTSKFINGVLGTAYRRFVEDGGQTKEKPAVPPGSKQKEPKR